MTTDMFTCHKHFPILSSIMTYHRVCNQINTTGATSGAGTAYPFGSPEFTPNIFVGFVLPNLQFYVCFVDSCLQLLSISFWSFCFSALLQITDFDYPFGIFKLFLQKYHINMNVHLYIKSVESKEIWRATRLVK